MCRVGYKAGARLVGSGASHRFCGFSFGPSGPLDFGFGNRIGLRGGLSHG